MYVFTCPAIGVFQVYFAEKDNPQGPWSFLDSFWWGLMTLTTVGYGDLSPSTFPGKLIGDNAVCIMGLILFSRQKSASP
jgi:voltage-gated potassium channel Kch